jgi:protein-S-isoprenylcysteine O-methyltransferase Ste14
LSSSSSGAGTGSSGAVCENRRGCTAWVVLSFAACATVVRAAAASINVAANSCFTRLVSPVAELRAILHGGRWMAYACRGQAPLRPSCVYGPVPEVALLAIGDYYQADMTIPVIAVIIRVLWLAIEYPYLRRHRAVPAKDWDKHSAMLWDVSHVCELMGVVLGFVGLGRIGTGSDFKIGLVGITLLLAGVGIRWAAIYTLGKYFTGVVMIKDDHRIVRRGLYKGTLVAHLGFGLSFSNWSSIIFSSVPYLAAAFYRMRVEERALKESFGEEYIEYAKRTKRLIPKVY